jgi:mitofilin
LVEILSNINIIKRSAPNNQFINEILNSINEKSLNRGIVSAPDLKERFQGVKSVCKKVALIDERGGSLFKYFLSYLQSKFIIKSSINPNKMNHSLELDSLDDLNTFKILDYSQYFIEQGDFEMAIKLLQQLEGISLLSAS